jgi:hypothetical protein
MIIFLVIYASGFASAAITVGWISNKNEGRPNWPAVISSGLGWPLWWALIIVSTLPPMRVSKCAWCGREVAPMNSHPDTLAIWKEHYLTACEGHPLKDPQVIRDGYLALSDRGRFPLN